MEEGRKHGKKKKKLSARKVIGTLIIFAGIGVFLYPLCVQAYNKHEQEKMVEEIKAEILANLASQDALVGPDAMEVQDDGRQGTDDMESPETGDPEPDDGTLQNPGLAGEPQITPEGEPGDEEGIKDGILGEMLEQVPDAPEEEDIGDVARPNRLSGRNVIGLIEIEAIDLFYPIVEGTEEEDIGVAIGHMTDTADFGAIGNCALAGHRGGYSGPYFKKLDKLKEGDAVVITNAKGTEFVYKVTESMVVEPTDVWVVEDTGEGKAILTLVTCEEDGTKRLIVRCEMK